MPRKLGDTNHGGNIGIGSKEVVFYSQPRLEASINMLLTVRRDRENRRYKREIDWEIKNLRERIKENPHRSKSNLIE